MLNKLVRRRRFSLFSRPPMPGRGHFVSSAPHHEPAAAVAVQLELSVPHAVPLRNLLHATNCFHLE